MRKRILSLICLTVFCMLLLCPFAAYAVTPVDTEREASLTLCYKKNDKRFSGVEISVYRVAEAFEDGSFGLIEPFSSYPVNIHGITVQEQWREVADTLNAYIPADSIPADYTATTDDEGRISLNGLKTGLYLISDAIVESAHATYMFESFLVYLPSADGGEPNYQIEAIPKCAEYIAQTEYKVTKLWQDEGYSKNRPSQVTVEIYRDKELFDTRVLNSENNWTYTWQVPADEACIWSVAERNVPEDYKVTVKQSGNTFTVINTGETKTERPKTGDSGNILLWIFLMLISGVLLIILSMHRRSRS